MSFPTSNFLSACGLVSLLGASSLFAPPARASDYYRHVIFDNSLTAGAYFNSRGMANGGSYLEVKDRRLPVETRTFLTPPNALRLQWESRPGGGWEAEVRVDGYRNRSPELIGHNLYFWCYAPSAMAAGDLPVIVLSDASEGLQVAELPASFTAPLPLGTYTGDIPPGRWVQARIPLADLPSASIYPFRPQFVRDIVFHQGRPDGVRHTLLIDEIRVGDDPPEEKSPSPAVPERVRAFGYDWQGADPHSGMARESIPGDDRIVATGASGMGIAALIVGADRGFITRVEAIERLTKIVKFLEHAQRYHGAWSHYMDGSTGKKMAVFG